MKTFTNFINEQYIKNDMLRRAKEIDEPYVKAVLEARGWEVIPGTIQEDWEHIDLKIKKEQYSYILDVKRNSEAQKTSPNFTFTTINPKGEEYTFRDNGCLGFIDDEDGSVYFVMHNTFKNLIRNKNQIQSKRPGKEKSYYVLIPKQELRKYSKVITPASDSIKKLLK